MDEYVKRVKRPSNGGSKEPCEWTTSSTKLEDTQDLYFPDSSRSYNSTNMISDENMTDYPIVPGAPQKSCEPNSAPLTLPEMTDYWTKRTGQLNHFGVNRRLLFDEEIKTDDKGKKRKDVVDKDTTDEEMIILFDKKMKSAAAAAAAKNARFRSIVESISGRGFVVTKVLGRCSGAGTTATAEEQDDDEDDTVVLECVSAFEGIVYRVQASATAGRGGKSSPAVAAACTLSAIGPHPNIVAFHSSWSDGRFRYVQTELCPNNLERWPSGRLNGAADYRTVLEHVACALHYVHVCKGYAHNRVNAGNVYAVPDGDQAVVYKLGGFDGATRMSHVDAGRASFADVRSLCSTVLLLMQECDGDGDGDEDMLSLRSYVSHVIRKIDSATDSPAGWTSAADVNAFAVWRWCCAARQQQQQQGARLRLMEYGDDENNVAGPMDTAEAAIPVQASRDGSLQRAHSWRM